MAFAAMPASGRAWVIHADPSNYRTLLESLNAGDTLVLAAGTYVRGLPISNKSGTTAPELHGTGAQLWASPGVQTPHSPEQNGMVERVIRRLKEQCVHRHRFETLQHASRVIGDWI